MREFSWVWAVTSETYLHTCASKADSDQPAHWQSDQNLRWWHFGWPRIQCFCMQKMKTPIRLHGSTDWFESLLGAHARRFVFLYCGSYKQEVQSPSICSQLCFWSGLFNPRIWMCIEVLQPSQPNGVMSSMTSLPYHTFTGQA